MTRPEARARRLQQVAEPHSASLGLAGSSVLPLQARNSRPMQCPAVACALEHGGHGHGSKDEIFRKRPPS
jgi:hypothetical protein